MKQQVSMKPSTFKLILKKRTKKAAEGETLDQFLERMLKGRKQINLKLAVIILLDLGYGKADFVKMFGRSDRVIETRVSSPKSFGRLISRKCKEQDITPEEAVEKIRQYTHKKKQAAETIVYLESGRTQSTAFLGLDLIIALGKVLNDPGLILSGAWDAVDKGMIFAIRELRAEGLPDLEIGRRLGVTSQRIAYLAGLRRNDKTIAQNYRNEISLVEKAKHEVFINYRDPEDVRKELGIRVSRYKLGFRNKYLRDLGLRYCPGCKKNHPLNGFYAEYSKYCKYCERNRSYENDRKKRVGIARLVLEAKAAARNAGLPEPGIEDLRSRFSCSSRVAGMTEEKLEEYIKTHSPVKHEK